VVIGSIGANQQKMDDRNRLGGKGTHGKRRRRKEKGGI
jgi:hypothetical protein